LKTIYFILLHFISLTCTGQILFDEPISDEVGMIVNNYHKNGITKFSIEYKNNWINNFDSFSNILSYEFIDDSTFLHEWNGLEATFTIRNDQFIYQPTEEDLAYQKANPRTKYFNTDSIAKYESHFKTYEIRPDTILVYHGIQYDSVSKGLYLKLLTYDAVSGELMQKVNYYRLPNDTIRRVYEIKENDAFILVEDSKTLLVPIETKNSIGHYEYGIMKSKIYGTSPIQYSNSSGKSSSVAYLNKKGRIKKIVMTKGKRRKEKLVPRVLEK
jgi:hypothetical protein